MNDIEKVIYGRSAIEEYRRIVSIKGTKGTFDVVKLNKKMKDINMSIEEFNDFNLNMNLQEADRCYRFRRKDNFETPAICDSCIGRMTHNCYTILCGNPDQVYNYIDYTPNSLIVKEQVDYAQNLNIEIPYLLTPMAGFMNHKLFSSLNQICIGFGHKIIEPEFNLFWGMEEILKIGEKLTSAYYSINGKNYKDYL